VCAGVRISKHLRFKSSSSTHLIPCSYKLACIVEAVKFKFVPRRSQSDYAKVVID
jgi:hypothetical protein